LEVLLFSLICLFSVKTVQNSENSQYIYPNASKCFQIAKTVNWSPALCHTEGYLLVCYGRTVELVTKHY